MGIFKSNNRLTISHALSIAALAIGLSACASAWHSHIDSRGYATSAPTYYGGYYGGYYAGYYPYRYGYGYGYGSGYGYGRAGYGCGGYYYGGGCGSGGYYGYY
jgi:hypothetical protein